MISILKKKFSQLKISIDGSYNNINVEEKPYNALGALIAYYESGIEFRQKAITELINEGKLMSKKLLEEALDFQMSHVGEKQ